MMKKQCAGGITTTDWLINKSTIMLTITVTDQYAQALSALGDVETAVKEALQRYTVEQITGKIAQLLHRDRTFQSKYGMPYRDFAMRVATDEAYVRELEASFEPLWELDLAEWEFCAKGVEDWTQTLQAILLN